jgi:UDP-N-acetylglucosamine acyltransferase
MNQPLAYVHPGAKIAKMLSLNLFTIHNNVIIGDGTWIGSNVIMEGARIGKNCNIFPGAVISAVPQI